MKFGFIAKHRGIWPAGWLCEALGVSRGGLCRKEGINQNLYYLVEGVPGGGQETARRRHGGPK
jgi:hypothetical protein